MYLFIYLWFCLMLHRLSYETMVLSLRRVSIMFFLCQLWIQLDPFPLIVRIRSEEIARLSGWISLKTLASAHEDPPDWERLGIPIFVSNSPDPASVCIWVCLKMLCTPLYPMVLLIIIPMKNGYFIGNINPTCSDKLISEVGESSYLSIAKKPSLTAYWSISYSALLAISQTRFKQYQAMGYNLDCFEMAMDQKPLPCSHPNLHPLNQKSQGS